MKRLSYFMAVAMILAISCQKEEIKNNEVIENTGYTRTLTVGVADEADTRVGFDADNAFYWHEGDKIGVRTGNEFQVMTLLEEYDHQASGVFGGDFEGEMGEYVVYPHNAYHGISDSELIYVLPSSYEYSSIEDDANSFNAPMLGKITDGKATLNHLASFFKIIVENLPAGGDDMTFTFTADKRITGEFRTDPREELPEIKTDGSIYDNIVTISFTNNDAGADGYFYIPAPLGTYGSITVEVKDGEEILVTKTWQNQTVKRKTPKRGVVDGEEISDGLIKDVSGNYIVSNNNGLDYAMKNGYTTITLAEGEYDIHKIAVTGKAINITGASRTGSVLKMENTGLYPENSNVKLSNLTLSIGKLDYNAESTYGAMYRTASLDILNCNISGCLCLCGYGTTNIDGCNFTNATQDGFNGYGVFYYGYENTTVNVKSCTFDMVGKAIVMYNHSTAENSINYTLNVEKCTFNASNTNTDKAAIQMHTEQGSIYGTVNITKCDATGFIAKNNGLWNEINNNTKAETDKFDIYVDGVKVH